MRARLLIGALALAACGSPKPAAAPDAVPAPSIATTATTATDAASDANANEAADASASDAMSVTDITPTEAAEAPRKRLIDALHALGDKHAKALTAEADAIVPTGAPACVEASDAQKAELTKRLDKWVRQRVKKEREPLELQAVCVDGDRLIVGLHVDETVHEENALEARGNWWILRVGAKSIDVVEHLEALAQGMWAEWADERSLELVAARDLDGDGKADAVWMRKQEEGGAGRYNFELVGESGGAIVSYGNGLQPLQLAPQQPPAEEHTLVLSTPDDSPDPGFHCVGAHAPWSACPAAQVANRFEARLAAARELVDSADYYVDNAERLAEALAALEIPEADAAPLVAAAAPPPPSYFVAELLRTKQSEGVPEYGALVPPWPIAESDVAAIATASGQSACAPLSEADADRLLKPFRPWLGAREARLMQDERPCGHDGCERPVLGEPTIERSCAGARGTAIVVSWADTRELEHFERIVLAIVQNDVVTVLADQTRYTNDAEHYDGPESERTRYTYALFAKNGHVFALQRSDGGDLAAWLDDQPLEVRAGLRAAWGNAPNPRLTLVVDGLAFSDDETHVSAWMPATDGFHEIASLTLPTLDDAVDAKAESKGPPELLAIMRADALARAPFAVLTHIDELATSEAGRARIDRALAALGADATLVARVKRRLIEGR